MTDQPRGPVTIYDVAKAAGVAPSTVSRTFARPGRVNADTAERVRQVAEQLGYRSTQIRQGPATTRTKLLGVMVSDVANPFYSQLIRGTQLAANELGYEILLADSRESGTRERAALERVMPVVDGFIIGSSRMSDSALRMIAKQRPMVVLNRALADVPSVVTDNAGGVRAALELLRELHHDDVYYVAGPEAAWPDGARFRALRDHAPALGITVHRVGPVLPTFEGGLSAARLLSERQPTAVIGYNDLIAVGVMHGLLRTGLRVPEQVSVIGFDDILTARLVLPTLTTVAAPMRQMGATAVSNVVAIINGDRSSATEPMVMPVQLRIRGSTAQRSLNRVSPALGTTRVSGSDS
ncbi:MAG: LacI family DNA-binding transcriptional regulator [Micropruina sp.]|nr:LacI family DNA-binding transcriptional regulator [Micropruina sp.]